jgi:hypothetical protein
MIKTRKYTLLNSISLVAFSAIVGDYVLSICMPVYLMQNLIYAPK